MTGFLKKFKPITPGTRFKVNLNYKRLVKNKIEKYLLGNIAKKGGRNNTGRIMVRHQGGGCKRRYRKVLFKRVPFVGIVTNFEYDPNRTSFLAKVFSITDNTYKYILAPENLNIGDTISYGKDVTDLSIGNSTQLKNIPTGTLIHNIEIKPYKGGQLVRSAGSFAYLVEKVDNKYAHVRLRSGEQRLINLNCFASIGIVGNSANNLVQKGKAGKTRWLGIRPTVRGIAMNPVDHPHGGGQGKTSGGRPSVTPKGRPTKGSPTRKRKFNDLVLFPARKLKLLKKKSTRKGKFSY
jgi:large subunit ribosomal protein L2